MNRRQLILSAPAFLLATQLPAIAMPKGELLIEGEALTLTKSLHVVTDGFSKITINMCTFTIREGAKLHIAPEDTRPDDGPEWLTVKNTGAVPVLITNNRFQFLRRIPTPEFAPLYSEIRWT